MCDFVKINDVLSIRFFNYKMAIAFLVIVNIKYDILLPWEEAYCFFLTN